MSYPLLLLMSILFIELVSRLRLLHQCRLMLSSSQEALTILSSDQVDDSVKERAARTNAAKLLKASLWLVFGFALIAGVLWVLLQLAVALTDLSLREFEQISMTWTTLLGLTVFAGLYIKIRYADRH